MGGLLSSLQTSSAALDVFSRALGVDQTNISNASTPGYAAQRATILPIDPSGSGAGGSDTIILSSTGDSRADAAVQASSSEASYSQTQTNQLSSVNQLFDITGTSGILAAFQQFTTAFSSLSVSPNDPTLGAAALTAAGSVASAFRTAASSLDSQRNQVDSGIQSTVAQINSLAGQIRQLNIQAAGTSASSGNGAAVDAGLRNALDQLSSLVDIKVTTAPNGSVSVLAGGQLPLVIGDQAYSLSAVPSAAEGVQITSSAGGNSPASFSGQLGALLGARNGTLAQLLGSGANPGTLNSLAAGFAGRVNTLLSAGTTAAGAAGVPIFTFDATDPANAARTLTLDSTVTPDQLGLATQAQANGVANQLAGLPGSSAPADQISGLSAQDLFGSIASTIGQQLADARTAASGDQTSLTAAQADRQQQSGVSLDQEAVTITAYERSYEASAKVVSILDQLLGDTVDLIK